MPVILITGKNGNGKGQFAIRKILEIQDENDKREKEGKPRRQIYANIHGINEDGCTPLKDVKPIPSEKIWFGKQNNPDFPPPDDYFVPPLESVFFYDECQRIDWIAQKAGALSSDLRVKSMEEQRHAGLDVYLITQSPNYIHSHLFGLVSPHFYVERALNLPQANVFRYNSAQKSPESTAIKKKADDHFVISLGKKYGQYYKSSEAHNMKLELPKMFKFLIVLGFLVLVWNLYNWNKAGWSITGKKEPQPTQTAQPTPQAETPPQAQAETPPQAENEPIKQEHLDYLTKDELIEYVKTREKHAQNELQKYKLQVEQERLQILTQYDELQKRLIEHDKQIQDFYARLELYKKQLPKNYEITKQDPALQVRAVVKRGNKCSAYNTHGDLMTLSFDECNHYLQAVGRVHKGNGQTTSLKADPVPKIMGDNPNFGATPTTPQPTPQTDPQPTPQDNNL